MGICNLQMPISVIFLRGEIESGFHLSKTYYKVEMCAKCVLFIKEKENFLRKDKRK